MSSGLKTAALVAKSGTGVITSGGANSGWVSGTIAALAALASIDTVYDLGPNWAQFGIGEVVFNLAGPSSGLSNVSISGSDTVAYDASRLCGNAFAVALTPLVVASITVAAGVQMIAFRPKGRYVIVRVTNADAVNALGAGSSLVLAVYPD